MHRVLSLCAVVISSLMAPALVAAGADAKPIKVTKQDEGFAFTENGAPVLFYQLTRKAMPDGRAARSNYVHPLYDLDGKVITEDFPADHIHHRGIYWAWHQVLVNGRRIQDQWSNADSFWEVQSAAVSEQDDGATLRLTTFWESPKYTDEKGARKPFVEERMLMRVHPREGEWRKVDFQIALRALVPGVQIGGSEDDKGYGGFSVRVRMPDDIRFAGQKGVVTPIVNQVGASPWMDISGTYNPPGKSGVVVLTHPSTVNFPQPWILRAKGSMQNPVYPGRQLVALPSKEPVMLRYRLVLHRGELDAAAINRLQAEYAREVMK